MRAQDLHEFTRKRPFVPFRIYLTGGEFYDIRHPDQAMPLRSRVVVGVGGNEDVPDRAEHLSLFHIVKIEELASAASQQSDS